jgi:glycosyltransferase involved in cell wall biosynthesis
MAGAPSVSICIPAYNAARWIENAVGSALAQTFEDFELVVVDNASDDDTVERVAAFDDERIVIVRNATNIGAARNFNLCIARARAPLVKFLHADDQLYPECLKRLTEVIENEPRVGIVFSPRDVIVDDPDDPAVAAWVARYGTLHGPFGDLPPVSSGRALFDLWVKFGIHDNLIGEPSVVLVRRECFERVGLADPRLTVSTDIDMWLRILLVYDVGFVPEPLTAYRHHAESITGRAEVASTAWLDDLMVLDNLLAADLGDEERVVVERARALEARHVRRALAGRVVHRASVTASISDYLQCSLGRRYAAKSIMFV